MIPTQRVSNLVEELFPDKSGEFKAAAEAQVLALLEGKDLGFFKGEVSPFKKKAIDTAAMMKKPVISRNKATKAAGKELDKLVTRLEKRMNALLKKLRHADPSKRMTKTQFKKQMKAALGMAYLDAYKLGTRASGLGRANVGLEDHVGVDEKKWVDNVLKQESKHFNKFLQSMITGESNKKARMRIRNYSNAVRSVFESSRILQLPEGSIIHWVLQSDVPCRECKLLHSMSPFTKETLPTTPKAGSTRCLSYCYCKLRVVKPKNRAQFLAVQRKHKSAANVLKKLRASRKKKK